MITTKHNISKEQYKNATFAICTVDASHHLILEDGRSFFLGEIWDSLEETQEYAEEDGFTKETVSIEDTTGLYDNYEAYTIKVKDADFGIFLDDFNNGEINWI